MTTPSPTSLQYLRLYTDENGVSQFAQETYDLRPGSDKGQGSLASYTIPNVQGASYVALKRGALLRGELARRARVRTARIHEPRRAADVGEAALPITGTWAAGSFPFPAPQRAVKK